MKQASRLLSVTQAVGIESVWSTTLGRRVRRVVCVSCAAKHERNYPSYAPPDQVQGNFENQGWRFTRRGPLCPSCAVTSPKEDRTMSAASTAPTTITFGAARAPTVTEVLKVSDLLALHFVEGRYRNGYSDEVVAKEKDIPRAVVTRIREEGFGPIKGDAECDEIRQEITAAKQLIATLETRLQKVEARLLGAVK